MVSVIIPGYCHARYLRERIDSVLAQDYSDFEVILLDDCSPDGSAEIMLGYGQHPRVSHVVINEQNSGNTFLQWQRGIALAKGEYIWIAESDDVAEPTFLSRLVPELDRHGAVMAYSYSRLIDSEGSFLPKDPNRRWLYKAPGVYDGQAFARRRLSLACLVYNASMVVWRKSCFQGVNKDFARHRHGGDWMFWFDVCRQGLVVEVPEYLNRFRQHEQKVTVDAQRTGDGFRETAPIQAYILRELQPTAYQQRVVRGRLTQRLQRGASQAVRRELEEQYPCICSGSFLDRLCYNIDKIFNFSGYQYHSLFKG